MLYASLGGLLTVGALSPLTDELLIDVGPVQVGCVDECDPQLLRAVEDGRRIRWAGCGGLRGVEPCRAHTTHSVSSSSGIQLESMPRHVSQFAAAIGTQDADERSSACRLRLGKLVMRCNTLTRR